MEEWKEYKLGEIASMKYGKLVPKNILSEGSIPIYSGYRYVGYTDKSNCSKDTIIVVARGVGGTGDVKITKEDCFLTNLSIAVDLDKNICNPYYFYYKYLLNNLKYLDSGSAQSQITIDDLKRLIVRLPNIETQCSIVNKVKIIDDKIEVNRRINEQLEELAQALFKSWFVDFEPFKDGEFVESELVKLGDVVKTTSGGTPSRKHMEYYGGNYGWVKSKELNGTFIVDTEETITDEAIAKSSAKLLPEKSILIAMYGATVGQYAILSKAMTCNQAVCALLPNDNYPYTYLFMYAKNKKDELINKAVGSAQQNISQILIKDLDISNDIQKIKDYHKIVSPAFEIIEKNQKEITHLTNLRDTLLPKLMSGEIDV